MWLNFVLFAIDISRSFSLHLIIFFVSHLSFSYSIISFSYCDIINYLRVFYVIFLPQFGYSTTLIYYFYVDVSYKLEYIIIKMLYNVAHGLYTMVSFSAIPNFLIFSKLPLRYMEISSSLTSYL